MNVMDNNINKKFLVLRKSAYYCNGKGW